MTPIKEGALHAEKFSIFKVHHNGSEEEEEEKNHKEPNSRVEELSKFSFKNKRVINKIIKQKNNLFINEMEGAIKHMSNILDFENKRTYFKTELQKLKKNQHYDQISLTIRRDNIFMDTYAQLNVLTAEQMKNRLHINYIGERG